MSKVRSATQSFCCKFGRNASDQYFAWYANQSYSPRLLNSINITIVMGASVGPKFVMVCVTPSSVTLKFSFFKPVSRSPWLVVAITSRVTTGTSTEMLTPPGGACGGVAGACGACAVGAGAPPCGPVG